MMTIDEMHEVLDKIAEELPEAFFRELNGGVALVPEAVMAEEAVDDDLYTLGEYCEDEMLGRCILLYYGSFEKVFEGESEETIVEELRETLYHEFTHHLESLAGEFGLDEKDAAELATYLEEHRKARDLLSDTEARYVYNMREKARMDEGSRSQRVLVGR